MLCKRNGKEKKKKSTAAGARTRDFMRVRHAFYQLNYGCSSSCSCRKLYLMENGQSRRLVVNVVGYDNVVLRACPESNGMQSEQPTAIDFGGGRRGQKMDSFVASVRSYCEHSSTTSGPTVVIDDLDCTEGIAHLHVSDGNGIQFQLVFSDDGLVRSSIDLSFQKMSEIVKSVFCTI